MLLPAAVRQPLSRKGFGREPARGSVAVPRWAPAVAASVRAAVSVPAQLAEFRRRMCRCRRRRVPPRRARVRRLPCQPAQVLRRASAYRRASGSSPGLGLSPGAGSSPGLGSSFGSGGSGSEPSGWFSRPPIASASWLPSPASPPAALGNPPPSSPNEGIAGAGRRGCGRRNRGGGHRRRDGFWWRDKCGWRSRHRGHPGCRRWRRGRPIRRRGARHFRRRTYWRRRGQRAEVTGHLELAACSPVRRAGRDVERRGDGGHRLLHRGQPVRPEYRCPRTASPAGRSVRLRPRDLPHLW